MKPSFKQEAFSSFMMWFDHVLLDKAEAFVTRYDLKLVPYPSDNPDNRLPDGYKCYASAFKEWVIDEGIPNAMIAENSAFFDELGNQIPNSSFMIDYINGRIIFDSQVDYEWVRVASVSIKEVNIYTTNSSEEELITETMASKHDLNYLHRDPYDNDNFIPIEPYDPIIPSSFLTMESGTNLPFELGGGLDQTVYEAKAIVFTKTDFELDCILGYIEDSARESIPILDFADIPFNEWGDRKYAYDYKQLKSSKKTSVMYIEDIVSSKTKDVVRKKVAPNFYVGFLDFKLVTERCIRK